eukprot:717047-Rhodomonas_salina.1
MSGGAAAAILFGRRKSSNSAEETVGKIRAIQHLMPQASSRRMTMDAKASGVPQAAVSRDVAMNEVEAAACEQNRRLEQQEQVRRMESGRRRSSHRLYLLTEWGGSSPATSAPTNGNGAVHDFRPFSDRYLDPTLASLPQGLQLFDKTSAASNAIEDQPVYIAAELGCFDQSRNKEAENQETKRNSIMIMENQERKRNPSINGSRALDPPPTLPNNDPGPNAQHSTLASAAPPAVTVPRRMSGLDVSRLFSPKYVSTHDAGLLPSHGFAATS